jgi:hypothetical protein
MAPHNGQSIRAEETMILARNSSNFLGLNKSIKSPGLAKDAGLERSVCLKK